MNQDYGNDDDDAPMHDAVRVHLPLAVMPPEGQAAWRSERNDQALLRVVSTLRAEIITRGLEEGFLLHQRVGEPDALRYEHLCLVAACIRLSQITAPQKMRDLRHLPDSEAMARYVPKHFACFDELVQQGKFSGADAQGLRVSLANALRATRLPALTAAAQYLELQNHVAETRTPSRPGNAPARPGARL